MQPTIVRIWTWLPKAKADREDARGHYTIGKEMVDNVIDRIRRVAGNEAL
jgi:hypothetical protein